MKYAEQPEKFMESEVDLDEEVQRLLAVAGSPELYPEFVRSATPRLRTGCNLYLHFLTSTCTMPLKVRYAAFFR
jgi:hypothetical protein